MKSPEILKQYAGFNKIINGNFDYWQRGTSFTGAGINFDYTCDRWQCQENTSVGAATVSRSTDVPNNTSKYSYKVTASTGYGALASSDLLRVRTIIEDQLCYDLKGKDFILGFWIKATKTGILPVTLAVYGQDNFQSLVEINQANLWEYKAIALPQNDGVWPNANYRGIEVNFSFAAGSDFDSALVNEWGSSNIGHSTATNFLSDTGDEVLISQVMLHEGKESIKDYVYAGGDVFNELRLCQRYYEYFTQLVCPGFSVSTANTGYATLLFNVEKRTSPTLTYINVTSMRLYPLKSISSLTFDNVQKSSCRVVSHTTSDNTDYVVYNLTMYIGYIYADAEL